MPTTTQLRERLRRPEILVAPGAYDGLTAKLVQRAGFEAVYLTGGGSSYSQLARPDLGLLSFTEMLTRVGLIAECCDLPIIADGDTGYGNYLNMIRTIRQYIRAGAAGIQIEDQVLPKKCGHLPGRDLISVDEMLGKIRAAQDARTDSDFVIMVRTDARAVAGLDEAIRRARLYCAAGADLIYVEGPESVEEMRAITGQVPGVHAIDIVEGGRIPLLSARELQAIGYRLAIFPNSIARTVARCASEVLQVLREQGTTAAVLDRMYPFDELQEILGMSEIKALDLQYGVTQRS